MSVQFDPVSTPGPLAGIGIAHQGAGSLAPLLELLTACRPDSTDALPARPRLVVFGADHGIAAAGVSAFPVSETGARLSDLRLGQGSVAEAAAAAGVGVRAIDLRSRPSAEPQADSEVEAGAESDAGGTDAFAADAGPEAKITYAGRIDIEDALTPEEVLAAIAMGRDAANAEVDEGADLLIGAVCSVGVSTAVSVLVAAITGIEPVDATSRGSGISDAAWIRKAAAVRDALYRARLAGTDAVTLLRVAGGADLAALTGFLAQAAVRRTPVLIDDVASTACAVLAHRLAPGADAYLVATALSAERGHRKLLDVLGRDPLTGWSVRWGSGLAATLLVPVIRGVALAGRSGMDRPRTADAIDSWDPGLL